MPGKNRRLVGAVTDLTARPGLACYRTFGRLPMDKYKLPQSILPSLTSRVVEALVVLAVVVIVILLL